MTWALFAAGFAASAILTGVVRAYALRHNVMDVPTGRSSHTIPTPRGGGVAFVVVFTAIFCGGAGALQVPLRTLAAVAGSGIAMALLGFADDHRHVPAGWRLIGHFAGAAWALWWLGDGWIPSFFGAALWRQAIGYGVAAVGIVWLLNLYNFMDGIDGIASIEAITTCVPGALLIYVVDARGAWPAAMLLTACTAGFLAWNFPPARIFMGDAGSNFLGIVLAILAMDAARSDTRLLWAWGILLGTFIVDATITLLRRIQRRERVHVAHRSHAYQYASRRHRGHRPVTLAVGAINLLWLAPIAAAVVHGRIAPPVGLALAYLPLVLLAFRYKAGAREQHESS